uniref:Pre-mRNA-splicing factor ISY1 n=1 Tax=Macrostomum lignano TaxID=282301 RepID=A0A1I8GWY2_9PLAT
MARNSEKAMTALARWRSVFVDKAHEKARRRPYLATECNDLQEAIRWRRDIIKEIAFKVGQIQNPGLGEFKLRDLNDEINKLFREKSHWEDRIKELGGPDYRKDAPRMLERDGKEAPGCRGYRYFGATRFLPGVRELFEADPTPPPRKTRGDRLATLAAGERPSRGILDASDDEQEDRDASDPASSSIYRVESNPADDEILGGDSSTAGSAVESSAAGAAGGSYTDKMIASYRAHVPVPSQKEIEAALLERKKAILLNQYMTDDMIERARETEAMLGVQTDEAEQDEEENDDEANK